jgi:cytidine deaminase
MEGMPLQAGQAMSDAVTPEARTRLIAAAEAVMQRAYAPYSNFFVGAAVLGESGATYTGCNVENASYGLTICAERNAIFAGVAAEGPKFRIRAIAVTNRACVACSPCGACRQVIYEFGPEALVIFRGNDGYVDARAKELLPAGFSLL